MDSEQISEILVQHGVALAGTPIHSPAAANAIYLPLRTSKDAMGKRSPSHKTLATLRETLEAAGYIPEFLLIDPSEKMVEEGMRASFLSSFPSMIRNAFVTASPDNADVWVETKTQVSAEGKERLQAHAERYFSQLGSRWVRFHIISESEVASNTEILSTIRRHAPVGCEELKEELERRGFEVPSLDWVNRKFDTLRRTGLLVRRQDRMYVLTAAALHRLGTRKDSGSPDIGRLLAMARRGG